MPRALGPFQIIAKYGENAYKVDLPEEYNISSTFNIGDLKSYHGNTKLRTILPQEGGVEPIMPGSNLDTQQGRQQGRNNTNQDNLSHFN